MKNMRLRLEGEVGKRARNRITYHGRAGNPIIHANKQGRRYIMVRAKGGGTKRLYAGSKYEEG